MNKLAITMYSLSALFLAACGSDAEESTVTSNAESASGTANPAPTQSRDQSQSQQAAATMASNSYTGFDIAGIYLGMSPEEAETIIKDYAPDLTFQKDLISFDYNALGARYSTDSFVNYMGGSTYASKLSLAVRLSYPPEPLKVVGIYRGDRHQDSPIAQSVYVESLIEKYGPPTSDSGTTGTGVNALRTLDWTFGNGTVECFASGGDPSPPILDSMVQNGRRYPDPTPEFAQQCISKLRYDLRGEPVVRANGSMLDVAASVEAEFANRAWIQSLIDEKSAPGTDRPQL